MLDAAGPELVRERAVELTRLDPAIFEPATDGTILAQHEPDDLLAQVRRLVRLAWCGC